MTVKNLVENLKKEYKGERLTIVHCDGAVDSFKSALEKVSPHKRKPTLAMHIVRQIETLANLGRLSGVNFPKEGALPNGSHFYALKKIPIRGYCWFSNKHPRTVFISHYIYKSKERLSNRDGDRVIANWRSVEE